MQLLSPWGRLMSRASAADRTACAVLFTGGRDSTLAAWLLHEQGHFLHLLTFDTGLGYGGAELREIRIRQMHTVMGPGSFCHAALPAHGLVRDLCFLHLVEDVKIDDCQLILLGEFLAVYTAGMEYCLKRSLSLLAFGAASYQSTLPEQQAETLAMLRAVSASYGVELVTPVYGYGSELEVKLQLLRAGLSPKSLEGATVLADIDDDPPAPAVADYINRKVDYIHLRLSRLTRGAATGEADSNSRTDGSR